MANAALWPMGEAGDEVSELQMLLQQNAQSEHANPLNAAMQALFQRDSTRPVSVHPNAAWECE